jgi:Holliday junction resolvase
MLESHYQRKVISHYEKLGYYCIKIAKSNKNGIPDLLCIKPDEVIFIEVKGTKTKHEPLQEFRKKELTNMGFKVIIDRHASI